MKIRAFGVPDLLQQQEAAIHPPIHREVIRDRPEAAVRDHPEVVEAAEVLLLAVEAEDSYLTTKLKFIINSRIVKTLLS